MYRVLKTKGYNANVVIENTDTKANIMIGKLDHTIIGILDKNEYGDYPATSDEWSFEVSKETASELSSLTMKMKKPIRKQIKKEETKKIGVDIDAFDLIFG